MGIVTVNNKINSTSIIYPKTTKESQKSQLFSDYNIPRNYIFDKKIEK